MLIGGIFYIDYNVHGDELIRLIKTIETILQCDAKRVDKDGCLFEIDYFSVDENGCVSFDARADTEEIESLIIQLAEHGFVVQMNDMSCEECYCNSEPENRVSIIEVALNNMPVDDVVAIFNKFDFIHIHKMSDFDSFFANYPPIEIVKLVSSSDFYSEDAYFYLIGNELFSFSRLYDSDSIIDIENLARTIDLDEDSYGNAAIQAILDGDYE